MGALFKVNLEMEPDTRCPAKVHRFPRYRGRSSTVGVLAGGSEGGVFLVERRLVGALDWVAWRAASLHDDTTVRTIAANSWSAQLRRLNSQRIISLMYGAGFF